MIEKIFSISTYRVRASDYKSAIRHSGGVQKAVDIIEQAISTGKPVIDC
jgi:hypothetical protein